LNTTVKSIDLDGVTLENGKFLPARIIFDARGNQHYSQNGCGFQKFFGLDVELEDHHGVTAPVIMDATCQQQDGYRFFYLLPWSSNRILVEDTRYSDTPDIDFDQFRSEVLLYCKQKNWKIKKELRVEAAALPLPFSSSQSSNLQAPVISIGLQGGLFHFTTGYSLYLASQVAEAVAQCYEENQSTSFQKIFATIEELKSKTSRQNRYFAMLNRMAFRASPSYDRWKIFSRFYQLPEDLIFRFYRGNLSSRDRMRIMIGKPPVSVIKAIRQLLPSSIR
jgi:lycopene beta-cyclase